MSDTESNNVCILTVKALEENHQKEFVVVGESEQTKGGRSGSLTEAEAKELESILQLHEHKKLMKLAETLLIPDRIGLAKERLSTGDQLAQRKQAEVDDQVRKLLVSITGPTTAAFVAYAVTTNGTPDTGESYSKILLALAASTNAVGFLACLASLRLTERCQQASRILDRVGCASAASGVMLTLAMVLPMGLIWFPLLGATFFISVASWY